MAWTGWISRLAGRLGEAAMNENEPTLDPTQKRLKKWDLVIKSFGTLLIAIIGGFVTVIGYNMESNRTSLAEHNKTIMAIRDSWVKQKELDLNLGIKMFETLITQFMQKTTSEGSDEAKRQQLLLLRLISLNFQDTPINLKPLFEQLDSQLDDKNQKTKLREIAMEVARRQAFRLTFQNGWESGEQSVKKDASVDLQGLPYKIQIIGLSKDQVRVSLLSMDNSEQKVPLEFDVNFFAMPLVDNTKLGPKRVSVMQLENDGATAKIRVIIFDSYLAADRFDIKEMTRQYEQDNLGTTKY
jgi:hypothetical protein